MTQLRELAATTKAWPFQEARRVIDRLGGLANATPPDKGEVLFETGYGPSGLPHIGTFGEVARTSMVRHAFATLCDVPSRLIVFSDDMDGLRRVPGNVPNQDMLAQHLGKPLTAVPDPFGTHDSFAAHNNARLRAFLNAFAFDHDFVSSTEAYKAGRFDKTLVRVLAHHDAVRGVILPTLGEERRRTYSPFLPVCPRTGRVLQAAILETKPDDGTVVYRDPDDDTLVEIPVTGGHCKLQWKADWAMRWVALDIDYEMSGKDLIDSVTLSSKIVRVLGARPPETFIYELFLDENGQRISKSKGNGLTIDEWLTYGPPESLALFMYQKPRAAKRLYFDVIPKFVDDYADAVVRYADRPLAEQLESPAWHIHQGDVPPPDAARITFAVLLNLVSVCNTDDKAVLWGFISRHGHGATPEKSPHVDGLVDYALAYYRDFVKPAKQYRPPNDVERAALEQLAGILEGIPEDTDAEAIQGEVYAVGKGHPFDNLRDWFRALYEVLFGQSQGPRFGSFAALYGVRETAVLIRRALAGEDLSAA